MTVTSQVDLNLTWLHCNECHRSFDHHNRLSDEGGEGLRVIRSDLMFAFTSCGHFYCIHCIQQHTIRDKFICSICQTEASVFKIDNHVPKALDMYLKPPITQLEDSISVMTFQITNANHLIKGLRSKVAQQKELISKAKQELGSHKLLKEKVNELQQENERLRKRLEDVNRAAGIESVNGNAPIITGRPPASPLNSAIHVPGRLSLRSPMRGSSYPPSVNIQGVDRNNSFPSQNWPRSPTVSEIYVRNPERDWNNQNFDRQNHLQQHGGPPIHHLAQPIYNTPTPDNRYRGSANMSNSGRSAINGQQNSQQSRGRTQFPSSPRPVNRPSNHSDFGSSIMRFPTG